MTYQFIETDNIAGAGMNVTFYKQTLSEFGFGQSLMFYTGTYLSFGSMKSQKKTWKK